MCEANLLTRPNVCAVQRTVKQGKGDSSAQEIIVIFHQGVPQDHTDAHQKLRGSTVLF